MGLAAYLEEWARRHPEAAARAQLPAELPSLSHLAPTRASSFPQQWEYETSEALYNAVMCSRRAGKTTGAWRRHARKLLRGQAGTWTHFGSLIRRNARKHFWNPLIAYFERNHVPHKAWRDEMIIRVGNGNWCQAFGCDDEAGTKAVQGDYSDLFTIDECHLPNDNVLKLLVDVSEPMLTDRGGQLDLLGLPPEAEGGFFSRVLDGLGEDGQPVEAGQGFAVFNWTMFDHDFPRSREKKLEDVQERCRRRGLPIVVDLARAKGKRPVITMQEGTHPLVARQYFGKRVSDPDKRAYEYQKGRNDHDPKALVWQGPAAACWGQDIGFGDHDALAVLRWLREDGERHLRCIWYWQHNHLDVFDLADFLRAVREVPELRPSAICGDHGGHGAVKVMKSLERVLRMPIKAKPGDVMVSAGFLNDDFRTGRLTIATDLSEMNAKVEATIRKLHAADPEKVERLVKLLHPKSPPNLPKELGMVTKERNPRTGKVEINKKGFHSDLSESLRYARAVAFHDLARAPKPEPTPEEARRARIIKRRQEEADPYR